MLIVYQSLESTKNTDDLPSTVITGNSFKRRVHNSRRPQTALIKSRTWSKEEDKIKFETTTSTTPFATEKQSKALSEAIKKLDDDEKSEIATSYIARIIERIVDNASACTRPKGLVRPFVRRPDVIVLGEFYASTLDTQVISGYAVLGGIDPTGDARHRFTVFVQTGLDGVTPDPRCLESIDALLSVDTDEGNKDEDSICMLMKMRGWLIAFVHTPNSICNKPERAAQYLHNNAQRFGEGSKLDLVIGDTNQGTSNTVKSYMNGAYNRKIVKLRRKLKQKATVGGKVDDNAMVDDELVERWDHSIMPSGKQVIRGYTNYEVSGTNSNYTKHFDIACTPEAHVSLTGLTLHKTEEDELTHTFKPEDGETYSRKYHRHVREEDDEVPEAEQQPSFLFHGLTDKFIEWETENKKSCDKDCPRKCNGRHTDDCDKNCPQGCTGRHKRFYAYSDHNGVIIEILRDKPDFHHMTERRRRREMVEEFRERKRVKRTTDG